MAKAFPERRGAGPPGAIRACAERGKLNYRHMLDGQPAVLRTRLVEWAEIDDVLPPDIKRVNNSERTEQQWDRFEGGRDRFPL